MHHQDATELELWWPPLKGMLSMYGRARTAVVMAPACSLCLAASLLHAADLHDAQKLYRTGKYAEAIGLAAQAIAAGDISEAWPVLKLKGELTLGRYADARKTLEAALARFPYSAQLHWLGRDVYRFNNLPDRAKRMADELGEQLRQAPWRYRDAINEVVVGRFMLSQGVDPKQVLDALFNDAKKQQPNAAEPWLASGELALDKNDFALSAEAFERATKLAPDDPDAKLGLARAFAPSDPKLAQDAIEAALAINPFHLESLFFLMKPSAARRRCARGPPIPKSIT
ncbi:MAG: hypothetical protein B7Z73_08950 [Planctomycetia bacterium 21-64-5]|nr:MAG: hypothetical protein B7Z73_08950 [Planctomycetia bacterium 21-64-5]